MDKLEISSLQVLTKIGIHPWEKKILQPVLFDITIPIDVSACQNTLANTIDYAALCEGVITFVENKSFELLETVAEDVTAWIQTTFSVKEITLRVSKPTAIKQAKNIAICITRPKI